ncbi:MAG TPA: SRPBCC family protein [bacterium]|nr:SRPBCC family protein [bacterium]
MSKPEFVYVSYIATTAERMWAALTQGEFTQTYWFGRRIESTWSVGAPVTFFDRGTDVRTDGGVVLECDPPRRLVYTFRPEPDEMRRWGMSEAEIARHSSYSRVSFTIEPHEGVVKLTLVHDQLPDEQSARDFREGWAPILSSLKTLLETGKPLPPVQSVKEKSQANR